MRKRDAQTLPTGRRTVSERSLFAFRGRLLCDIFIDKALCVGVRWVVLRCLFKANPKSKPKAQGFLICSFSSFFFSFLNTFSHCKQSMFYLVFEFCPLLPHLWGILYTGVPVTIKRIPFSPMTRNSCSYRLAGKSLGKIKFIYSISAFPYQF